MDNPSNDREFRNSCRRLNQPLRQAALGSLLLISAIFSTALSFIYSAPAMAQSNLASFQQYQEPDGSTALPSAISRSAEKAVQFGEPGVPTLDDPAAKMLQGSAEIQGESQAPARRPPVPYSVPPYSSSMSAPVPVPFNGAAGAANLAYPQNPFMPAWLPAYAQALSAAAAQAQAQAQNQGQTRPQLKGYAEQAVTRPNWIPGYAFSNAAMITEYHNLDIMWWDKRPIPAKPQMMKLSQSVVKYWDGYKESPFWVKSEPDAEHPGSFIFYSLYRGGPKGWLQAVDEPGPNGFPQYRYWFDPR